MIDDKSYIEFIIIFTALSILCSISIFFIRFYQEKRLQEKLEARLSQARISDIDQMEGIEFEQYLVVLFKNLGIQARRTPASNDFGADLILEGQERVVVQAKRYKSKVGIKAVQEINSAKSYYKAQEAWVITNNFFTSQAIKLSESTDVKLIDRNELVELILSCNITSSYGVR